MAELKRKAKNNSRTQIETQLIYVMDRTEHNFNQEGSKVQN